MSDRPQYPSYPGDGDPSSTTPQDQPPAYGQQLPPAGYGQVPPPGYGQVPAPGFGYPPQPYAPSSTKAVVSLVLGILSIVFCYLGVLIGPAAIILSVLARKDMDARPHQVSGRGMAIAGLVTGIVGTLIWGAIDVLVALAVANDW